MSPLPTFLEPGGDADFGSALWGSTTGAPTLATDHLRGGHQKAISFPAGATSDYFTQNGVISDAGFRVAFWHYVVANPTSATRTICRLQQASGAANVIFFRETSGGVLQLSSTAQLGGNSPAYTTGAFHHICIVGSITSAAVHQIDVYVDGILAITERNGGTLGSVTVSRVNFSASGDATYNTRLCDIYVDTVPQLLPLHTVTAKRPFANGTTNGFTGSGTPSGYGTGNARYVNERPIATGNLVAQVGAGSAVTEEYTIEGASVGDFDLTGKNILGSLGWVYASSLAGETAQLVVDGVQTPIALTNVNTLFRQMSASANYPAGGADIGLVTDTSLTTVSLYEAGVVVAACDPAVEDSGPFTLGRQPVDDLIVSTW